MEAKLITVTPNAEELIAYCARVSSSNQTNPDIAKLLGYCYKHGHWSIFEHAHMTVEITCSRAIAAQLLRHRSFCFQEFSTRYAKAAGDFHIAEARAQDLSNRQNSLDILDRDVKTWFNVIQTALFDEAYALYEEALGLGIAKECARNLLPLATMTRLYMTGNVRSWVHYLQVRTDPSTQLEHREVAESVLGIFSEQFPVINSLMLSSKNKEFS